MYPVRRQAQGIVLLQRLVKHNDRRHRPLNLETGSVTGVVTEYEPELTPVLVSVSNVAAMPLIKSPSGT